MPKCIQIPLYIVDIDLPIYPKWNMHGAYFITVHVCTVILYVYVVSWKQWSLPSKRRVHSSWSDWNWNISFSQRAQQDKGWRSMWVFSSKGFLSWNLKPDFHWSSFEMDVSNILNHGESAPWHPKSGSKRVWWIKNRETSTLAGAIVELGWYGPYDK